jgi:hypothetical protein
MLHLRHVNAIVVAVRADPLDPDDRLLEVHRHDQPVVVALDVEHNAVGRDDTRRRVEPLQVGRAGPASPLDLVEPGIQRGLQRRLVPVPGAGLDELPQRAPGNDPHADTLPRAQIGRKATPTQPLGGWMS